MVDFTSIIPHVVQGKHNMASDAFAALQTTRTAAGATGDGAAQTGDKFSFDDILDTLNPLQHIPVVSSLYREITGDTISPQARVAGGALYGGPIGLVASVFDAAVASVSGADVGEHVIATLTGGTTAEPTAVADAAPPAATTPAADRALPDGDRTGSLATTASATPDGGGRTAPATGAPTGTQTVAQAAPQGVPKALPQLSPEAFNALLGSFADPKAARAANPALAAASAAPAPATAEGDAKTAAPAASDTPAPPGSRDLAGAIEGGLDQLDALKRAHPDIPLATSFAEPGTGAL